METLGGKFVILSTKFDKLFAGYFVVSVAGGSGSISTAFLIRLA